MHSAPRYWPVPTCLLGILILAVCLGTLAQFFGPSPIPWVQDHSQSPLAKARAAGIDIVSLEQAREVVSGSGFLVLDARSASDFDKGHLPGAISFPNATRGESYYELAALLQPDQPLLIYCSGKTCDDALQLGLFLREQGYKKILLFSDGFQAWKEAGLPVE
jgi:rhodanese-related sulfurtransferase